MRELRELRRFVTESRAEEFILCTIIATEGSSYRKEGAKKIIDPSGKSAGLLSGGCLENEIIRLACEMNSDREEHIFDTTADTDRVFGYATGCEGKITVEYRKVNRADIDAKENLGVQPEDELSIIVLGAGPDLDPLAELLQWSGWNYHFLSPQSDLVAERKALGWPIEKYSEDILKDRIQTPERTALLLMSHNYPTDLDALAAVTDIQLAYIGVLGPKRRRDQMLTDLELVYKLRWPIEAMSAVEGPIGDPGFGRGEMAISLAVVARLQQKFFGGRG